MDARPNVNVSGLRRLGQVPGYEVPPGEPDLRGWRVATPEGRTLGVVVELLVEPATLEPQWLEVLAEGASDYSLIPARPMRLAHDTHTIVTEVPIPGMEKRAEDVEEERTPLGEALVGGEVVGEVGAGQIHVPIVEGDVGDVGEAEADDGAGPADVEVARAATSDRTVLLDTADEPSAPAELRRPARPAVDRDPELPGR